MTVEKWDITIEAWPYSTGNGQEADQKAAGPRSKTFRVRAEDFNQAVRFAQTLAAGVKANPAVWRAPIQCVRHARYDDVLPENGEEVAA